MKDISSVGRGIEAMQAFTATAMLVGGVLELYSNDLFVTPIEQIGLSVAAGVLVAVAVIIKTAYFVR